MGVLGEKKTEHGADALGPAGFVVSATVDALEVEVGSLLPAVGAKTASELFRIVESFVAFLVADVEPEFGTVPDLRSVFVEIAKDGFAIPPDAGREDGELAEAGGETETEEEGEEAAE